MVELGTTLLNMVVMEVELSIKLLQQDWYWEVAEVLEQLIMELVALVLALIAVVVVVVEWYF